MLQIPEAIYREMVSQAKAEFPLECCGLLGGKGTVVSHLYKMTNADQSKTRYLMEPREQFKVFKEMRDLGIDLLSIYHSHPKHPAYPSMTDVQLAFYPEAIYIIMSIDGSEAEPLTRGFRIIQEKIEEVSYELT